MREVTLPPSPANQQNKKNERNENPDQVKSGEFHFSSLETRPISKLAEISLDFITPALAQLGALRTIKHLLAPLQHGFHRSAQAVLSAVYQYALDLFGGQTRGIDFQRLVQIVA